MSTLRRKITVQLYENGSIGALNRKLISDTGGVCYVAQNALAAKNAITDKDGVALTNPRAFTNGLCEFYILNTVEKVDLFIMAPGGQFVVVKDVNETNCDVPITIGKLAQMAMIPFAIADTTAGTETDTGFDLPDKAIVLDRLHGAGVKVLTLDVGQNILFGILSSESGGDADGLSTNVSLTTAVLKTGVNGALFSTNAPFNSDSITGKSISYTLDASTDTGAGFILLPYRLAQY